MPAICDHAADGSEKGDTTIDDGIVQDRRFRIYLQGKLSAALFSDYLKKILKPYVTNKEFLLLLDSWRGPPLSELHQHQRKVPLAHGIHSSFAQSRQQRKLNSQLNGISSLGIEPTHHSSDPVHHRINIQVQNLL
ncbi:unnamed protein product, partial [Trichogramma brassicae]